MDKKSLMKITKDAKKMLTKRAPEILTGVGIAGMVTSTVFAVKATPKAIKLIENAKKEKETDKLTPVETVKTAWKPYVPAVMIGGASVACLIGATTASTRRHAALYSAYKLSETALSEYKDKVAEVVDENTVKEIKQKIAEDKVNKVVSAEEENGESKTTVIVSSDGDTWFIDPFTHNTFKSTTAQIDAAINRLNKNLLTEMFVSLSDLYDELDMEHTPYSDEVGWCIDDDLIESDYSDAVVKDGKAYVVMDFLRRPYYGYDDKSRYYG